MGISSIYNSGGFHSEAYYSINSLERQVDQLKKELSAMKSSVANMKDDIQNLKKNNLTLENKISNAPTIGSSRGTTSVKSRPTGRIPKSRLDYLRNCPQVWQVDHRIDDDGVEWAEDETGNWYYRRPGESDWTEWIA
jgi:regulator of replication initiation timing